MSEPNLINPENPLAVELQQEAAAAYFSACRKMVDALEAFHCFDRAAEPGAGATGEARLASRAALLEEAAERVYFVIIQREAMKLSWNEAFFANYGITDEVRRSMGPKRRK